MEYEEIELLKQSPRSTVSLVRDAESGQVFIRKVLNGPHPVYKDLQGQSHPFLPVLHEVAVTEENTTVVEEYIEGEPIGNVELSEKRFLFVVRELCSVLEFLHGQGIIHRDIKPSNIIMAEDGHIRLIDFDAARRPKDDLEQDTVLLGTRGFAPPEQYGFSQTDERADIYSLGVTLKRLGGQTAEKPHYKRVIRKCTDMDPEKRYQSARQVRQAFFRTAIYFRGKILPHGKTVLGAAIALCVLLLVWSRMPYLYGQNAGELSASTKGTPSAEPSAGTEVTPSAEPSAGTEGTPSAEPSAGAQGTLAVLPAPANPHWDGDTGIAVWGNVPESMVSGNMQYRWKLYRKADSDTDEDILIEENSMSGNNISEENFTLPLSIIIEKNGLYYFMVSATGDGTHYADSPYVTSDIFEYTGESAPVLPLPTDLAWNIRLENEQFKYYAIWGNLDEYEDKDYFSILVYDKEGNSVYKNTQSKERIMSNNVPGIPVRKEYLSDVNNAYRFTLEVISSRPNEYRSVNPDLVPEEHKYSPWYYTNSYGGAQ